MSEINPLVIDFANGQLSPDTFCALLRENKTAKHVTINLKAASGTGLLSLEGSLMEDQEDITSYFGIIAQKLPCLTHIVLDMGWDIMYNSTRGANFPKFPVDALSEIFRARAGTLVSLKTEAQSPILLKRSMESMQLLMRELGHARNLQVLDLSWLQVTVLPEIHSWYPDSTWPSTFDQALFIITINSMQTLRRLSLRFEGCGTKEACSIVRGLTKNNFLTNLALQFHSSHRGGFGNDQLNSVLETALETNFVLKYFSSKYNSWSRFPVSEKAAFWLKMNRLGRKTLLENTQDHQLWLQKLLEQKGDYGVTYHLLSSNLEAYFPTFKLDGGDGSDVSGTQAFLVPRPKKRKLNEINGWIGNVRGSKSKGNSLQS